MTTDRRSRLWEALEGLLARSHRMRADMLSDAVTETGRSVEIDALTYLVDLEQRILTPLREGEAVLDIDGSVAGRAYRTGTTQRTTREDGHQWWSPLLDGPDRHGVVRIQSDFDPSEIESTLEAFVSIIAELLVGKSNLGDSLPQSRRRRETTLAAELRWSMLPPLSFLNDTAEICAVFEPAYEIAGDTFDYAVDGDTAHLAIFDAVGHGLHATRSANLAVVAYRHSRRSGRSLTEIYADIDDAAKEQFGDEALITAQLVHLDASTGV